VLVGLEKFQIFEATESRQSAKQGRGGLEQERPHRPAVKRASGAPPRAQYRLYFMHRDEPRISHSHEFEAESDERAIRISEGWREGRRAELWAGSRKLRSWDADR
jgi:hypothetical protein